MHVQSEISIISGNLFTGKINKRHMIAYRLILRVRRVYLILKFYSHFFRHFLLPLH